MRDTSPFHQVEALLDRLEALGDPAVRDSARELVGQLLGLHRTALARMVETAGEDVAATWGEDALVAGVLLLHGLHPLDLAGRVQRAVAACRFPGIDLRLLNLQGAGVRLRLEADGPLDAEALQRLQARIDEAFAALAPEIESVWVQTPATRRIALPLVGRSER